MSSYKLAERFQAACSVSGCVWQLWYVSMRAVDAAGNKGPLGNIAALWVPRPPTTYEITTRTHPSFTTLGNVPSNALLLIIINIAEMQ